MRKLFRIAALLFCLLLSSSVFSSDDETIKQLIKDSPGKEKYPHSHTLVLFDSTSVKVMDTGLSYYTNHTLTKVLTPRGAIDLLVQNFGYDPLTAYVEIKKIRIFRTDGSIEEIPLKKVLDHTAPARAIYWGAREKMVPVGRLEIGDALECVTFKKGFTYALLYSGQGNSLSCSGGIQNPQSEDDKYIPPMKGHFYDIVPFWSSTPILVKSYTVSLPQDKPIQYRVYNGKLTSWIKFQDKRTLYHWHATDIPVFKREPNMVAASDVAPKLLLSTAPDWEAKSRWFYGVNEDYGSFEVTPQVQKKVDQLIKNCKTDMEKVEVLTHWVAEEIRYSGLSMGEGEGYTLHKGEMTFRDRCGVCKDKAGMLITMLRAAGFESYAAMTMAGSRIDRIPADQFNHSVTIWKRGENDYVLLDPTWVPGVRELWSSAEQQQQYLMGIPEGADLMTTPISPPENHYFRVKGESKLKENGTLTGRMQITAEGQSDAGIRRNLRRGVWYERFYIEQALNKLSPRLEIISLEYTDPYDLSKPINISVEYRIPEYATVCAHNLIFTPLIAKHMFSGWTNSYLHMNLNPEERDYGFRIRCSKLIDFQENIKLPSGYKISYTPEFDSVQGTAADFSCSYNKKGSKLTFKQTLSLKKRIYSAREWPNFQKAVNSVKKVMDAPVILKK
ncbi:MAG: DUF3857 domain-containing transglutaminase family protein [bacterium]